MALLPNFSRRHITFSDMCAISLPFCALNVNHLAFLFYIHISLVYTLVDLLLEEPRLHIVDFIQHSSSLKIAHAPLSSLTQNSFHIHNQSQSLPMYHKIASPIRLESQPYPRKGPSAFCCQHLSSRTMGQKATSLLFYD